MASTIKISCSLTKSRKVHSDGIHFQGFRYTNPNLAAFVGESVLIRYTPNDLAEIRVFLQKPISLHSDFSRSFNL